jgi:tetraprenyl-beta-curcumene synthase
MNNPMALSARQIWALISAATRELVWGLRAASQEIDGWRERALRIPDVTLREDAVNALACKRTHILGAALFWTLPRRRDRNLIRLLVAYEAALEFLDNTHERAAGLANGLQLHQALLDALDPANPLSDYYLHHPWKDDDGYLLALVQACREVCASLPSYQAVQPLVLSAARRCGGAQSSSHQAARYDDGAALKEWAAREFPDVCEASWWELGAAASSSVGVHALLALAACPTCADYARVNAAYVPWICAVSTVLDSYADQASDALGGQHSYMTYYPSPEIAVDRMCELIARSAYEASRLPDGQRHSVILACMIAMYLSADGVRTPAMRDSSRRMVQAGGSLTRMLVPIVRVWRIACAQRAT